MKNAKNAHYWQIDHQIKNISASPNVVALPIQEAWERFNWLKKYFLRQPKEGYFVWVKKQTDSSLRTCVTISSSKTTQNMNNLLVLEDGIKAKIIGVCSALDRECGGTHQAKGKIILKPSSSLIYEHHHSWTEKNKVATDYSFSLAKNASLKYTFKSLSPPKKLSMKTFAEVGQNANLEIKMLISGAKQSSINLSDAISLKEKGSSGITRLRLVGKEKSILSAKSSIAALAPSKGHLDCQGLIADKQSEIDLSPRLMIKNKEALVTHEASIGKISEEQLNYLRTRGFSEKEAVDLIIGGFLEDGSKQ